MKFPSLSTFFQPLSNHSKRAEHAAQEEDIMQVLKKVRQIEMKTKGLTDHFFGGEYHSAFKGRGMSFSEVREYSFGDDVRSIDWNVTARFNSPFIKVFEEERELTLMLLVDISASTLFGTGETDKRGLITEICATLAYSAISNQDKVGVIFFSDKVERYIPPKKGKSHILFIIRELITLKPHKEAKTDVVSALRYLNNIMKKRSIVFLLSDFRTQPYKEALTVAAKRHDITGVFVYDPRDKEFPEVGLVRMQDSETGKERLMDTSQRMFQQYYTRQFLDYEKNTKEVFTKSGCDLISLSTKDDYIKKLQGFFKNRK